MYPRVREILSENMLLKLRNLGVSEAKLALRANLLIAFVVKLSNHINGLFIVN